MSVDSITEDEDSFDSNTDAIIYGTSDHSGESMISGPNIASSSDSSDDHLQQISTGSDGGTDDLMIVSSSASSKFTNNKQSDHQEVMIFNVDFRALSDQVGVCSNSDNEVGMIEQNVNLNFCGQSVSKVENEDEVMMKTRVSREIMVPPLSPSSWLSPLSPSSWSLIWDCEDVKGIFEVPPLSPLSPHPCFGFSRLLVL